MRHKCRQYNIRENPYSIRENPIFRGERLANEEDRGLLVRLFLAPNYGQLQGLA
jgi:hypothetical protein